MNTKIEQAIEAFRNQAGRYGKTNRYYRGEHNLNFATEKFANTFGALFREFALNLCPAIVDATRDKLKITGFGIESLAERGSLARTFPKDEGRRAEDPRSAIEHIWRSNRMAIRAGEVHKEALKNGDAYLIVWPAGDGGVHIFPNSAESVTVRYDEEVPGRIVWAAKYWRTADKHTRLNLFFPDRIEKYISTRESGAALPEAKEFVPYVGARTLLSARPRLSAASLFGEEASSGRLVDAEAASMRTGVSALRNPFDVVPVFHFANNADIGSLGASELEAAIPVQDGLNKSVLDMLVAMEVSAYRQRWAAGIEIQYDADGKAVAPFKAGIDHLWLAENPDAKFGDFAAADLEQFLNVKDGFRIDMASVTGTPLYYLMPQIRGFPSGESLRKAETRFLAKVRDRQEAFGAVWADAMSFALRTLGHREVSLITNWEDASPVNERDLLENLRLKKDLGVSTEQVMREAGYGEIDVRRMTK